MSTARKTRGKYRLEHGLDRILSPVTLIFPDRSMKEYRNGAEVAADVFDCPYEIRSISAVDDTIGIILVDPNEPDVVAVPDPSPVKI